MTLSPTEQAFAWWQMFVKELCFEDKSAILKAEWDFKKVKKGKVTLFNVGSSFSNKTGINGSRRCALYPPCLCQCSVLRVFKAMATRIRGKSKQTLGH